MNSSRQRRFGRRSRQLAQRRRLQFEPLECRYVLNGEAILAPDAFSIHQNAPQTPLAVLANDTFDADYAGQRLITSVSYGSQGGRIAISADKRSILYTPPADYFGTETFVYAVDGHYTATVEVNVQSPLAFDHYDVLPDGVQRQLNVLDNDPFWEGYLGARRITSISVGSQGGLLSLSPDGKSVRYTPSTDSTGRETFIYVVDNIYPAQVSIDIAPIVKDDSFEMVQGAPPTQLNVLANDPFSPGYTGARQITHVSASQSGATIAIAADGKSILYTPGNGANWDSFTYVVDGKYETSVSMTIYRPVVDDWLDVDQNSTDFYFAVTANDRYYDRSGVWHDVVDHVTSVSQPAHGTVSIAPDGFGILFTPTPGFKGQDTFTYTADGKHLATVNVQVRDPVRDDNFSTSVFQDTPGRALDVLSNDFIGNGYQGARLITTVGSTAHGGIITISSDGKTIRYMPAAGYTGADHFTYMVDGVFEADVSVYVQPLVQPDIFTFDPEPFRAPYELYVLGNDFFDRGYAGPGIITSVELVDGSGQVSINQGHTLLFDPAASGNYTIRYTVDGKYEGTVSVSIRNAVFDDHFVVDENSAAHGFDLLPNDFYLGPNGKYYIAGPRLITSVTQSQHGGVVTIDPGSGAVHYKPATDFVGSDTFTYTVDDFMTATVTVEVIRRVRDDQFRVDSSDGPQSLPVLVNDLLGADYSGPGIITSVTITAHGGTVAISNGGHGITFTPAAGFTGTDTFTYTVDGVFKANVEVVVNTPASTHLPKFASIDEYVQFLIDDALHRYDQMFGQPAWTVYPYYLNGFTLAADYDSTGSRNHSTTNVQVAGVDEGDIVEFDSDYLYTLTRSGVAIVSAWPAAGLSVASQFDIDGLPIAEFLNGDRLTVISTVGGYFSSWDYSYQFNGVGYWPQWSSTPAATVVTVIDVSDRAHPTLVQKTKMEGEYVDSRAVDDFVYVLVNNGSAVSPAPQIIDDDNDPMTMGRYETREEFLARINANKGAIVEAALPTYESYGATGELVRSGLLSTPENIFQPLVPGVTNLVSVVSFDVTSNSPGLTDTAAIYSTGASKIYASLDNFYVFDNDYSTEDGNVTRIMKFDWDPATGGIDFVATTTVAGTILNQFSADENGNFLRIATTVSNSYSGNWTGRSENLLFVLQEDDGVFEAVGSLQNLALNESMQSVRFMGDRAFISTFRNVDPLFAVDLSDPAHPEAVGHITLPGFTTYMQLIDANHLLTVGRNTPMGMSGPTQVSLFDISNLAAPERIAEYTFERFSMSEAETDHHAFGYYAEFGLLAMPIARSYVERIDTDGDGYRETSRTVQENELAVFSIDADAADPAQRLVLTGEIEHGSPVRRSGYIGDKLYSIADGEIKVVDVTTPNTVIASTTIEVPEEPGFVVIFPRPIIIVPSPLPDISISPPIDSIDLVQFRQTYTLLVPQAPPSAQQRLAAVVRRARTELAGSLGLGTNAPLLITAEATPNAPGGGYSLVFRVGSQQYLYRANDQGLVQLINRNYHFDAAAGAWHEVAANFGAKPGGVPGDFNHDNHVDDQDAVTWRAHFGNWSLTDYLPADANNDGSVDATDFIIWRKNLGAIAGDFNRNGVVDQADRDVWRNTFGSKTDLRADANHNGVVDTADYLIWRSQSPNDMARSTPARRAPLGESVPATLAAPVELVTSAGSLPAPLAISDETVEAPIQTATPTSLAALTVDEVDVALAEFPQSAPRVVTSTNPQQLRAATARAAIADDNLLTELAHATRVTKSASDGVPHNSSESDDAAFEHGSEPLGQRSRLALHKVLEVVPIPLE